jgi:hypothetical protein
MKRNLTLLLAGLVGALGLFSCAPPASRSGGDFLNPADGTSVDGIPADPAQFTARGVTDGLRAGDQAINRNNIDSILNNPSRTARESRPGLATGWGKEKTSRVIDSSFVRASSKPAGTDIIYYNNPEGIKAMTGTPGFLMGPHHERIAGSQQAAGGLIEWGVKGTGGFLTTYKLYGKQPHRRLVAGSPDQSYRIVIKNRCKSMLEIVASVDGLDVMDGKTASFSKRGYLVDPGATLEIDGFRTSSDSVAAFKFSSVSNSYANLRHGDTRNVGVIGIAVFTRKGVNPWTWMPGEVQQRTQARAFAEAP